MTAKTVAFGKNLAQEFEQLGCYVRVQTCCARRVTAGTSETCNQTFSYWVIHIGHEPGYRCCAARTPAGVFARIMRTSFEPVREQILESAHRHPREVRFRDKVAADDQSVIPESLRVGQPTSSIARQPGALWTDS